jgi:hypothetical protein
MTSVKELSESVSQLCNMLSEYNSRLIGIENKLTKIQKEVKSNGIKSSKTGEQLPTQRKLSEMQK